MVYGNLVRFTSKGSPAPVIRLLPHRVLNPPALAPDFLADFGFLYATTGKDSLAAHYFEKAVSSQNHPRGLLGMGCVYAKKNQLDQALVWLEKALATRQVNESAVGEAEDKFLTNLKANKPARKKYEAQK